MKIAGMPEGKTVDINEGFRQFYSRRKFFGAAAGLAGAGLFLDACRRSPSGNLFLGKGDTGLLNYLYLIAQVQAGFYAQSCATPYYNATATQKSELDLMNDLRDHQLAYCGFYSTIIGTNVISKLVLQLSQVTFADRTSTLSHASTLQDCAVGAYTGVLQLLQDQTYLPILVKIASVEARHAEYVRDALNYNSFGDNTVIDANGLGQCLSPHVALSLFTTYLQTSIDAGGVPTF